MAHQLFTGQQPPLLFFLLHLLLSHSVQLLFSLFAPPHNFLNFLLFLLNLLHYCEVTLFVKVALMCQIIVLFVNVNSHRLNDMTNIVGPFVIVFP